MKNSFKKWIAKHVLKINWYEEPNFVVQFVRSGQGMRYSHASGFFEFNGQIFFKTDRDSVGRSLENPGIAFASKIEKMGTAYRNISAKEIGNLMVYPLNVIIQERIN